MPFIVLDMDKIIEDLRFYFVAGSGFAVTFANINTVLKFALLVLSIIYTAYKVFRMIREDIRQQAERELKLIKKTRENVQEIESTATELIEKIDEKNKTV